MAAKKEKPLPTRQRDKGKPLKVYHDISRAD